MKFLYAINIRIPTEKAHGAQVMKTCEALVEEGVEVTLAVANRSTPIETGVFEYYGMKKSFSLVRLYAPPLLQLGSIGFVISTMLFGIAAVRFARKGVFDVIYGRDEIVLYLFSLLGYQNLMWESHVGAWNVFSRHVARKAHRIVVISEGLRAFYIERGVASSKLLVAHDGVDLHAFEHTESSASARQRLELPLDEKIIMYVGRLDGWKGADTFCAMADLLPAGARSVVIGGELEQIQRLSEKYSRVTFVGPRPYRELADNQAAADILVLPNTGKDKISVRFTSPLKLFTYMASGRPIVASDLPSLREILNEENAVLVTPDEPKAIAAGIEWILNNPHAAEQRAKRAKLDVQRYSWKERAHAIIAAIQP